MNRRTPEPTTMRSPTTSSVYLVCRTSPDGGNFTPYLVCQTRDQADTAAGHIEKWMQALFAILPEVPEITDTPFVPDRQLKQVRERSAILDVVQWPYNIDRMKQCLPIDERGRPLPGQMQVVELPVLFENGQPG